MILDKQKEFVRYSWDSTINISQECVVYIVHEYSGMRGYNNFEQSLKAGVVSIVKKHIFVSILTMDELHGIID